MPIQLKRTTSTNPDFVTLVAQLDHYLEQRNGDMHDFYDQFNAIEFFKEVIVLYQDGQAVACGALKAYNETMVEIKRMYVHPTARKHGLATLVLKALEAWAGELGMEKCILETGYDFTDALFFYKKNGYTKMSNFAPYEGIENSICMEKKVRSIN